MGNAAPRTNRAAIRARAAAQRAADVAPKRATVHGQQVDFRIDGRPDAHTYVVELSRSDLFPLDMLRHDESGPATQGDLDLIYRLTMDLYSPNRDALIQALPKMVRVKLVTTDRLRSPNVKRWNSFGIKVVESDNPYTELLSYDAAKDTTPLRVTYEGTLIDWEDDGLVRSAQLGNSSGEDPHMFVELKSVDPKKKHPTLQALQGKRVRITVEVVD